MDLMHVCPPPDGFVSGAQLVLLALLTGGLPAAGVAVVLEAWTNGAATPWSPNWAGLFRFALIFQCCSLLLTTPILLLGLTVSFVDLERLLMAPVLLVNAASSAFAITSWRRLQCAVPPETPPSIRG